MTLGIKDFMFKACMYVYTAFLDFDILQFLAKTLWEVYLINSFYNV